MIASGHLYVNISEYSLFQISAMNQSQKKKKQKTKRCVDFGNFSVITIICILCQREYYQRRLMMQFLTRNISLRHVQHLEEDPVGRGPGPLDRVRGYTTRISDSEKRSFSAR